MEESRLDSRRIHPKGNELRLCIKGLGMSNPGRSALLAEAWKEPGDLEAMHGRIVRQALTTFQADSCTLFPLNPITGAFAEERQLTGTLRHPQGQQLDPPRPQGLTRQILDHEGLLVEDLEVFPEYQSPFSQGEKIRAFAAVALKAQPRPKPFAVLYIDYRQPQEFDQDYREKLQQFAKEASAILQNTWLFNRYRRVIELGQEVNAELDTVENLFRRVESHISQILDTSYFLMLATYSEQSQKLDIYCRHKNRLIIKKKTDLTPGSRVVIEERRPLIFTNYSADPRAHELQLVDIGPEDQESPESLIFLPLLLRGVPLGVISVQSLNADAYDNEDLHILEILANHIASALSNIYSFDDLHKLSTTGQILTSQSEDEDVLTHTVDRIHEATQADLVILYPYHQKRDVFDLPPRTSGEFLEPTFPQPDICKRPDSPYRVITLEGPQFIPNVISNYAIDLLSSRRGQPSEFQQRERIASVAVLPLRIGGETVGALYLNYRSEQSFNARQRQLIQGLAVFAAIAMSNAWKLGRRGRELQVLNQIDHRLRRTRSFNELLRSILQEANKIINADNAFILLRNPESGELKSAAYVGKKPKGEGGGIPRLAFESRQPINVGDVRTDPKWQSIYVNSIQTTISELVVPLLDGDKAIGVLNFESSRKMAFSEEDLRFVSTLAGQVALEIKKAQLYDRTQRLAHERQTLITLTKQVVGQLDLEKLFDLILQTAMSTTKAAVGALLIYDEENEHLVVRSEFGADLNSHGRRVALTQGVIGWVARQRESLYIPDVTAQDWRNIIPNDVSNMRSIYAVPLLSGQTFWGVLNLESRSLGGFKPEQRHLVEAFADVAVVALQNAHNHERAHRELARFEILFIVGRSLGELSDDAQRSLACQIITRESSKRRQCQTMVRIYDAEKDELALASFSSPWEKTMPLPERISVRDGLDGHTYATRTTISISDASSNLPEPFRNIDQKLQSGSLIIAPIVSGEIYYGNLSLSHPKPFFFNEADKNLAEGLSQLLAVTLFRLDAMRKQKDLLEAHAQEEIMSALGETAYSLAHRLGNDLGWIPASLNLLRRKLDAKNIQDEEIEEQLEEIFKAASRVLELNVNLRKEIQNLRPPEPKPVALDITSLFDELRKNFQGKEAAIDLMLEAAPGVSRIRAFPGHAESILLELVQNAVKSMPEGGKIRIHASNSGKYVQLSVTDTGPGIPAEHLDKLFKFGFSTRGGGFGLWSVQRKAIVNGGSIEVNSQPGSGSTFILSLPRADIE